MSARPHFRTIPAASRAWDNAIAGAHSAYIAVMRATALGGRVERADVPTPILDRVEQMRAAGQIIGAGIFRSEHIAEAEDEARALKLLAIRSADGAMPTVEQIAERQAAERAAALEARRAIFVKARAEELHASEAATTRARCEADALAEFDAANRSPVRTYESPAAPAETTRAKRKTVNA